MPSCKKKTVNAISNNQLRKWLSIFALYSLSVCSLSAQEIPRLGLALSGGGAKGLAHIGVIRELEKAGIYPDVVSGTSMGSIVGGLYSIGYQPADLDELASNTNWSDYFSDTYASSFIPIEQRRISLGYQLSFPLDSNGIVLPKGLLKGRKIQTLLTILFAPSQGAATFDDFPLPFRAIATDIVSGDAYTFHDGFSHIAVRASMAIPSIFAPVSITDRKGIDRLLVDGLVVRNLPVQDAIDMGAKVVLAVDVGAPLATKEELSNLISILQQTADFGSITFNDKQRALADIIIDPDLGKFTAIDYARADSIVLMGASSARKAMPRIIKKLDSLGISVPMQRPERASLERDSFFITGVRFQSKDNAATSILKKLFTLRTPGLVTRSMLEEQINRLYGSNFFDLIDFSFLPNVNGSELIIDAYPVLDWQVRFSTAYDSDFEIGLLLNLTGRNVIGNGSLLSLSSRISQFPMASLEYLLYTQTRPSIGVRLNGAVNFYPGRVYDNDELIAEYRAHHFTSRLSVFSGLGENRYLEAGILSEHLNSNDRFITLIPRDNVLSRQALFAEFIIDSYDKAVFPRSGGRSNLYVQRSIGGRERATDLEFNGLGSNLVVTGSHRRIIGMGKKLAGILDISGGFAQHNRYNYLNQLYLGRSLANEPFFFNAYGKRHMEIPVSGFLSSAFGLRFEVSKNNFIGLHYQYGVYARSETALISLRDGNLLNDNRFSNHFQGMAITLGSDTFLGPVHFNTEYDPQDGSFNFNLHFGYYF